MWQALHDVLKPTGRMIVTTPNYFHASGAWIHDPVRMTRGGGSGCSVHDVLRMCTYGHHWRIFSAADLKRYFAALSPDFEIARTAYFDHHQDPPGVARKLLGIAQSACPWLRETLYMEVRMRQKTAGIVVVPRWG
jgi:hypothetical protein